VRHVWINGRQVLRDGTALTLDPTSILAAAQGWRERIGKD
jgi:hypothetical protein